MSTKYHGIDKSTLEENFYIAYINILHNKVMIGIRDSKILTATEIKSIEPTIVSNYPKIIKEEIQKIMVKKKFKPAASK